MTPAEQKAELCRVWHVLFQEGDVAELRIPKAGPYKKTISGYFDNPAALTAAVTAWDGKAPGVYITLNPVNPALLSRSYNRVTVGAEQTTADADVVRRRWILADFDAERPAGISTTDAEHEAALMRARECCELLNRAHDIASVLADSGNGAHALLPVDLPNDADSLALVKGVLTALASRFNDAVIHVDQSVSNASRICKLYGTQARKGDPTPERPHRYSCLLDVPDELPPIPVKTLRAIAGPTAEPVKPKPERAQSTQYGEAFDVVAFLSRHGLRVDRENDKEGWHHWILAECPFNPAHKAPDAMIAQYGNGALTFKCLHNSCSGYGWKELRDQLEPNRHTGKETRGMKKSGRRSTSVETGNGDEREEALTTAQQLVLTARANTERFHSSEAGEAFVRFAVSKGTGTQHIAHQETWPVRSKVFREWLARRFYEDTERVPSAQATEDALRVLEGDCRFNGEAYPLAVRVTHDPADKQCVWLDLTNAQWNAVKVTPQGWELIKQPPVLFRRFNLSLEQFAPEHGGSLEQLFAFLNVRDDNAKTQLLVWLIAAFLPDIAHPVLVVHGEQGSAKSTLMRILGMLIDPLRTQLRMEPRDVGEWVQAAHHSWLVTLDNVSRLPDWLSDAICRAVTGEGFSKRMLYTDGEDVILTFRRVIALTGIEVVAQRADLLDRSILLALSPISPDNRRSETEVLAAFAKAQPAILGALLDLLARVLSRLPSVKLKHMPRMADFARVGVAVEQALGWPSGKFLRTYDANVATQHEEAIEASVTGLSVRAFMEDKEEWTGTATELLDALTKALVGNPPRDWPKQARKLSGDLTRLAPNLRAIGIYQERYREDGSGKRMITLRCMSLIEKEGESASYTSYAPLQSQTDVTQSGLFVTQSASEEASASHPSASQRDVCDECDDELLSSSMGHEQVNTSVQAQEKPNKKNLDAFTH